MNLTMWLLQGLLAISLLAVGSIVMFLAVGDHIQHRHPVAKAIPALVLLGVTAFVAWGRA
jgi:hypothetical protein